MNSNRSKPLKILIPLILICLAASPALADKLSGKKLIEYGWDRPGTAYVGEHITEMEKAPFDGVVICVAHKTVSSKKIGWHPEDFSKNYFTPQQLRTSLNLALESTDKYVWIYSQRINWWDGTAPKEFVDALRLCKEGP